MLGCWDKNNAEMLGCWDAGMQGEKIVICYWLLVIRALTGCYLLAVIGVKIVKGERNNGMLGCWNAGIKE